MPRHLISSTLLPRTEKHGIHEQELGNFGIRPVVGVLGKSDDLATAIRLVYKDLPLGNGAPVRLQVEVSPDA